MGFWEAYNESQQQTMGALKRYRVGGALAKGDTEAAALEAYRLGDYELGSGIEAKRTNDQDRQRQMARQDTQDTRALQQDERQAQMDGLKLALTRADAAGKVASGLRRLPEAERNSAFAAQESLLAGVGIPAEVLAQIRAAPKDDKTLDQFIATLGGEVEKVKYQFMNLGNGGVGVGNENTGDFKTLREPAPEFKAFDSTDAIFEVGGGTGAGGPMAGAALDFDSIDKLVQTEFGAKVNSSTRTPDRNASVNGQPDSYHLTGQARDYSIPQGMTAQQFAAQLQSRVGPQYEVIAEPSRNHVHIEPAPGVVRGQGGQGGLRMVSPGAPKQGYRMLSPKEKQAQGLDPAMSFQISPQGQISRLSEGPSEKAPTEGAKRTASLAYAAFGGNERMNELAGRGIYKPQTATAQLFDTDKNGVMRVVTKSNIDRQFIQAAKEFLAPILRKDTGAAVTDGELAFYMDTYIPRFEDDPQTMWQKAQARDRALRRVYGEGRAAYDSEYGNPGKWKVLTDPRGRPGQTIDTPAGAVKVRPVQ